MSWEEIQAMKIKELLAALVECAVLLTPEKRVVFRSMLRGSTALMFDQAWKRREETGFAV